MRKVTRNRKSVVASLLGCYYILMLFLNIFLHKHSHKDYSGHDFLKVEVKKTTSVFASKDDCTLQHGANNYQLPEQLMMWKSKIVSFISTSSHFYYKNYKKEYLSHLFYTRGPPTI